MHKILFSPRWWGVHLLVLVAILVMLRLGLWQWHRADSPSGGIQNYAYAVQWPLFAGFAAVLWWKTMRIEAAKLSHEQSGTSLPTSRLAAPAMPPPDIVHRNGVRVGITTTVPDMDEDDEEVRVYNAYLARLNARSTVAAKRPGTPAA